MTIAGKDKHAKKDDIITFNITKNAIALALFAVEAWSVLFATFFIKVNKKFIITLFLQSAR